jgi:crotonobetainyl-CoA:carnitine CoA-transferase CaiB-like acyl-CoA transferase
VPPPQEAPLDVQVATLANQPMNFLVSGKAPQRTGNAHPNIQPQDVFACRDGQIALTVGNDDDAEIEQLRKNGVV